MFRLQALIARYGVFRLAVASAIILFLVFNFGILGISKVQLYFAKHKVVKLENQLQVSKAETKAARKDEAQVTKAGAITAKTTKAQDQHAADQREATNKTVEIINERIIKVPVVVPVPDDPFVRLAVSQARARAQAAINRVQRAPSSGRPEP